MLCGRRVRLESPVYAPRQNMDLPRSQERYTMPATFVLVERGDITRSQPKNGRRKPQDPDCPDPYIAAALIGAAQAQAGSHPARNYAQNDTFRVRKLQLQFL